MTPAQRIEAAAGRLAVSSTAVDILHASYSKILQQPNSEKYRKVNLANPTMKQVSERPGAMELLYATGWEYHYGHLLLNTYDRGLIEAAVAALRRVQTTNAAYQTNHEGVQREAAQARVKAEAERVDEERRRMHAAKVPAEPPEGSAGAAKICVHLGGDKLVWRRFDSTTDTLQDLLNFVRSLKGAPDGQALQLENITQLPSHPLDEKSQLGLSLHHLDLWPAGHVRVSTACAA